MADRELDWRDFDLYSETDLPTHWEHVVSVSSGGGYEWAILHSFYDPTSNRYFWYGDSGCSCNWWGWRLNSEADFQSGSKEDLGRGIRDFCVENYYYDLTSETLLDKIRELKRWRPRG